MSALMEKCQDGTILHCFNWDLKDITSCMEDIAASGFSSVQLPPVQTTHYDSEKGRPWHIVYQPAAMKVKPVLKDSLRELCSEAHKNGVKVIVDVVSNHLIYRKGISPDDYKKPDHWHNGGRLTDFTSRLNITTGNLCGMGDLNTENKEVQQHVKDFLDELYESGADGIRWDAAKHIGLPSEGSDYWPSVLDKRFYNYGEILEGPVDSDEQYELMEEYASLMSVTDSLYGIYLVDAFKSGKAPDCESKWLKYGISAERLVFWGESHDTYSNGPDEKDATTRLSQNIIDRAYAVAASREGAAALYLSRPAEIDKRKIIYGTKGSMHFTSPEVSAVNFFHNAMAGKKDKFIADNNCAVITRKNGGAVIVMGSGSGKVTVKNAGGYAVPGKYTDRVSGNIFTVTKKEITGTVGGTGIAVIY